MSKSSYIISGIVAVMLTLAAIVVAILAVSAAIIFLGLVIQELVKVSINVWSGAVDLKEVLNLVRYGGF